MPRIVELLGFVTVAAGGMFVAIALAPMPSGAAHPDGTLADVPVVIAAPSYSDAPIVHLPPVEVVARRSVEFARISKGAARPKA